MINLLLKCLFCAKFNLTVWVRRKILLCDTTQPIIKTHDNVDLVLLTHGMQTCATETVQNCIFTTSFVFKKLLNLSSHTFGSRWHTHNKDFYTSDEFSLIGSYYTSKIH